MVSAKPRKKIYSDPYELKLLLDEIRERAKILVFANGCFDLLHVGHVRYLRAAKSCGDILVVAVNSDESMRSIKPDREPLQPDVERYEILSELESIDFVVPLRERTPVELITLYRPDVHTKGTDYRDKFIPERATVESYGGRVELVGDEKNHSTSDLIRTVQKPLLS